jgi:hypothetical protein
MSTQIPVVDVHPRVVAFPSTKSGLKAEDLRDDYLFGIDLRHPITKAEMPDRILWARIREAEDQFEKSLSLRFRPTRIVSEPLVEDDRSTYDEVEVAKDYDVFMYDAYRWGYLDLRSSPVTKVNAVQFAYPNRSALSFNIPVSWIRVDSAFGSLRIVPDHHIALANFQSYMLSIFAHGRGVPQSIYVDYEVGAPPEWWAAKHSDLLDAIMLMGSSEIIRRIAIHKAQVGTSISISADGLSQSRSGAADALMKQAEQRYKEALEKAEQWHESVKGPRFTVL